MAKPKTYQIQVHIKEGRELKGREDSGTSDPVCFVTVPKAGKKATKIVKKSLNCTWDHLMFFEDVELSDEELEMGNIRVAVFDANTIKRDTLIGLYDFGMGYVYGQESHELYNQWVALTDSSDLRNTGIQGYLQCSIVILGPGDQQATHGDEDEEEDDENMDLQSLVLKPPHIEEIPYQLSVRVYRAEGLPKLDIMGTLDPFVKVKFAGFTQETTTKKKDQNPVWNEEVRIPVQTPTMANMVEISLYDWDRGGSDDLVGSVFMRFTDLQQDAAPPRWYNFYGRPSVSLRTKAHQALSSARPEETAFVGRMLMAVEANRTDVPMAGRSPIAACELPAVDSYTLRFDLLDGSEFNVGSSILENAQVVLSMGTHTVTSSKVRSKNGVVSWYAQFSDLVMSLPADESTHPKIFIDVFAKNKITGSVRIGYLAVDPKKVQGFERGPRWEVLKQDKASPRYDANTPAGFLLYSVSVGTTAAAARCTRSPLHRPRMAPYQLRVHLYQARNLPAADSNGLSDPFVEVRCGYFKTKGKVISRTLNPQWYETLVIECELPQPLNLAPNIVVEVYDDDTFGKDLLGRFEQPVLGLQQRFPDTPKWFPIYVEDPAETDGEILVSFQLVPETQISRLPLHPIAPKFRDCLFEINIVGLREMLPHMFMGIQRPYIEFDCGSPDHVVTTASCSFPSGSDPNHLESLRLPVSLPLNPLFCPAVNVRVYDSRLGGALTPLVGITSIPIAPFLPWTNMEVPRELPTVVDSIPGSNDSPDTHASNEGINGTLEMGLNSQLLVISIPNDVADINAVIGKIDCFMGKGNSNGIGGIRTLPEVEDTNIDDPDGDGVVDGGESGRPTTAHELELVLNDVPFVMFKLQKGKKRGLSFREKVALQLRKASGENNPSALTISGFFKGQFRVIPVDELDAAGPPLDMPGLYTPKQYVVRVYILRGMSLVPRDTNGFSDPYIKIKMGDGKGEGQVVDDRTNVRKKTLNPDFYRAFELPAMLPGSSKLTISVWDWDFGPDSDDLIGETTIDIEERIFSEQWQGFMDKPTEYRTLWSPASSNPQGKVEMWVEVLDVREARRVPMKTLSAPTQEPFEVRVIVWQTKDVVFKDKNMSDILVSGRLGGSKKQDTDCHYRSMDGTGSFNWRMKFPVLLPTPNPRLQIALWDRDFLNANDSIAEANINLGSFLKKAGKSRAPRALERQWINLTHPNFEGVQGKVEISIEVLPAAEAAIRENGKGQEEPNDHPFLPAPDRPDSSFAPWQVWKASSFLMGKYKKYVFLAGGIGSFLFILYLFNAVGII